MKKELNFSVKEQAIIKKFMKERDFPDWFRGISKFQREAAASLLNCIRDDCQQDTTHRVRDALRRMGIVPLVGKSQIKFVMQLSRKNDIAFLWFLMQLYYQSSSEKKDTIPTLRELDKLLPKKLEPIKAETSSLKKKISKSKVSPYFEKQPRPNVYGKSLTMNEIDHISKFYEYENYRDPNYIAPNEHSRWFGNYKLNKSERIAKGIVKDEIDNIFELKFDKPNEDLIGMAWISKTTNSEGIAKEIVTDEIDNIFKQKVVKNKEDRALCAHHRNIEETKRSVEDQVKVKKRKECKKFFDVKAHFKNKSYKRVKSQLNTDISQVDGEIKILEKEQRKCFRAINNTDKKLPHSSDDESLKLYDFGHHPALNGKCNYFNAPTANTPYKFNYEKIFDLGVKNPIKDAIAHNLNAESSGNMSIEHCRAISKCCKKVWTKAVENHNLAYKKEQKAKKTASEQIKQDELQFSLSNCDPRDDKLMKSIVYNALQQLKKNKKFVLPSLPDAHKYPVFIAWIRARYGLKYTMEERLKALNTTKMVFHVLRTNALRIRIPNLNDLSRKRLLSYGGKDYLLKKGNFLRGLYEDNFKESLLEDARIYWAAIRPDQCSSGPPRNEFFSYLPGRKSDIYTFRPWKVREFMHAKDEWNKRQRNKKTAFKY